MTTTITSDSSYDTISLDDAKLHLRIFHGDLDSEIDLCRKSAIDYCERVTGRTLRTAVTRLSVYPCWMNEYQFDWQPVIALSTLTYMDTNDSEQTVASSNYRLHLSTHSASKLEIDPDYSKPSLSDRLDAVRLTYTTGYAAIADVPASVKHAVRLVMSSTWGDISPQMAEQNRSRAHDLLHAVSWGDYR